MYRILGTTLTVLIGFSGAALAAQPPGLFRGTVESIHGNNVTVQSYNGKETTHLVIQPDTKYAWVVRASISDIHSGTFVGITATGPTNNLKAEEVHIFPDSMRGTGEGHYPWSLPEAVVRNDRGSRGGTSTMTNGTMTNGTMTNGTMTNGTMTNGTMTNGTAAAYGRKLTVSYSNGQKAYVTVPRSAPIVRFMPAERSAITRGAKVFVVASLINGKLNALSFAVGKNGLMPPM